MFPYVKIFLAFASILRPSSSFFTPRAQRYRYRPPSNKHMATTNPPSELKMDWKPLFPSRLDADPSELAKEGTISSPQLAKDEAYARAIHQAWSMEAEQSQACGSESTPITYKDDEGTVLYGHVVRRIGAPPTTSVPGIVLFHTAVGPHDVCLHWKADSLVTDTQTFPHGCVVLIADILSDDVGWGWCSDRTRCNQAREYVLTVNENGECTRLQGRLKAALDALEAIPGVDFTRLAAMGWCFGGRAVLELSRMQVPGIKAMVAFHGVFDGRRPERDHSLLNRQPIRRRAKYSFAMERTIRLCHETCWTLQWLPFNTTPVNLPCFLFRTHDTALPILLKT